LATKEEKRNEILKATIKVIRESGFEGAKIEDIAKEAGIGKGTVYEYFESKNSLCIEMIRFSVNKFREGLEEALSEGDNMFAKIRNLSTYYAGFMSEHSDFASSSMTGQSLPEEFRREMIKDFKEILKTIEKMVTDAIRGSELRANIDPEMATSVIIGGIHQYMVKKIFMEKMSPQEIDHDGIAKVILIGLAY
jgi:AcrR family transcriptional regulator